MLSPREQTILKSIVGQYINKASPISSQSITEDIQLGVSPATVRNEVAFLEQEGYIIRPHTSAGSIPSDKGYRAYVDGLGDLKLPLTEQRLVSHLFHQIEQELDEWLNLAAALTAQRVQNTAIITMPKTDAGHFQHMELVKLQDTLALLILVLRGARVKEQLVTFEQAIDQETLSAAAMKLRKLYDGLTARQITDKKAELTDSEKLITTCITKLMDSEDNRSFESPFLDGLHFTLNQPELQNNRLLALALMELVEQRAWCRL